MVRHLRTLWAGGWCECLVIGFATLLIGSGVAACAMQPASVGPQAPLGSASDVTRTSTPETAERYLKVLSLDVLPTATPRLSLFPRSTLAVSRPVLPLPTVTPTRTPSWSWLVPPNISTPPATAAASRELVPVSPTPTTARFTQPPRPPAAPKAAPTTVPRPSLTVTRTVVPASPTSTSVPLTATPTDTPAPSITPSRAPSIPAPSVPTVGAGVSETVPPAAPPAPAPSFLSSLASRVWDWLHGRLGR